MSKPMKVGVAETIAQSFGPLEAHICIAEMNLLKAMGSLAVLAREVSPLKIHQDFEQDYKLRLRFEDPLSMFNPSRFGGPLEYAVRDMCARNMFERQELEDFLASNHAFIGPLLFRDPNEDDQPRLTHEVTVFVLAS